MKILKLLLIGLCVFLSQWAYAQNVIMDLSVVPLVPDTNAPAGMVEIAFEIKVPQPQNLQKIIILVGMQQNDGSIYTDSVQIVPDSAGYATLYNNHMSFIENYQTRWYMRLSETQWSQYAYITVFGRLSNTIETNRLFWQKSSQ